MSARRGLSRAVVFGGSALALVLLHELLLRFAAHERIAHVLLGAGNGPPPVGPALVAAVLVLARVLAIVAAPGLVLAALVEVAAFVLVGPRRQGSTSSSGAGISVAEGAGTSMGMRGTE